MLILAGVGIATLIGENGILQQAMKAKEETEIATEKELLGIVYIGSIVEESNISASDLKENLEKDGIDVTKITGVETFNIVLKNNRKYRIYPNGQVEYVGIEKSELTDIYVTLYTDGTLEFSNKYEIYVF